MSLETKVLHSITELKESNFNKIADYNNPFLEHEFLMALEKSGCVGENTPWQPRYLQLTKKNVIIGILVFYIKYDSYGEYIFDWDWAQAFHRSGLSYFPKVVVAIPFTPATGNRILYDMNFSFDLCAKELLAALIDYCSSLSISSIHFLCLTQKEQIFLEKIGFLSRITHQYHWLNQNYNTFNDFLDNIRSKRKKQIRKERKFIQDAQIKIYFVRGEDVEEKHIWAIWSFYQETHSRKWGSGYLNLDFFHKIFTYHSHRILLVIAEKDNQMIAGTFNYYKNEKLFGRYWGAIKHYQNLHFECCFYQLIEFSIQNQIKIFEAGAQGEHKFLRGFSAVPVYSSHYIFHKEARAAIKNYLDQEKRLELGIISDYNEKSSLKA